MGIESAQKIVKRKWQPWPTEHCSKTSTEFEVLCRFETKFHPLNKWLWFDRRSHQVVRVKLEVMPIELPQKILRSCFTKQFREKRDIEGRYVVELDGDKWLCVVAEQERIRIGDTPPLALFSRSNLEVVELHAHCSSYDIKAIHRRSTSRKRH